MSRCFPFPPPGYEKKARPDDANLIIKKKHKDKKDKDKKETSERKDKERTEGKHKEDKDRKKKKHRDKKDKKKDKHKSSEEKKTLGPLENQNGEKLGPDNKSGDDGVQDYKILVEMGKRVRNDDGATNNHTVQKITLVEQRKANLPMEENSDGILDKAHNNIKENREQNRMVNGQSLRVDSNGLENGWVANFSGEKQIKVEKKKEGKEKNELRKIVCEGDGLKNENRDKKKKEDKKRKKEEKKEKVKERSKKKIKQIGSDGNFLDFCDKNASDLLKDSWDSQGKLPKLKEPPVSNGFLHENGTRPNNMSRPTVSSHHQASQNGSGFHPSRKTTIHLAVSKQAVITNQSVNGKLSSSQSVPSQTANNSIADHKRANINNHVVSNGLISSNLVGNEKKTEQCQTRGKKDISSKIVREMDNKDFRINDSLECKKDISSRPSSVNAKEKKVGASMKPPHPDSEYLSQILSVPKVESPQFDDQEWLFGTKDSQAKKKPKLGFSQTEWTKQVWAEAIQVEYADVTALPYVIPY
ncbi:hypothetical protein DH2020_024399 [Rehmannia glutinosa]|uniref:Uncharacterized protein n=1 Tax=Rehmannia glutinosa TaxID=99300 RepID=A0ABR0W2G5_REHGL